MRNIVVLAALAPVQALATSGGTVPPPNPCAGQPGTVLVDGSYRTTNLQAALNQAHATSGHHTVEICSGLWQVWGSYTVNGDIALSAPDGPALTVVESTGNADTVFWLTNPAGVPAPSISGLTIRGPEDGVRVLSNFRTELSGVHLSGNGGAGLRAMGTAATIVLWDSVVENNGDTGVVLETYGSLDLAGTVVRDNTGTNGGGVMLVDGGTVLGGTLQDNVAAYGGGLYSFGTVQLFGTIATGNSAQVGGGVGAVSVLPSGVTVTGNTAVSGGGIWADAVQLQGSNTVSGNTAERGGGVYAHFVTGSDAIVGNVADLGGGVYLYGVDALVSGVEIRDNTAVDGGGIYAVMQDGGAEVNGAYVHDNQAERGGGVYMALWEEVISLAPGAGLLDLELQDSLVTSNSATALGGGIYAQVGVLEATDSAVDANDAPTGGGMYLESGAGAMVTGGSVSDNLGHGAGLTGDMYLYSSAADWTGNTPGPILLGTTTVSTPSSEFVCDELTGCTPRQSNPGGGVLAQ